MTTDVSFCQQRRLMQLYNVPLGRYTPINPYSSGNYTQFQLDMRRKTEILKYSANKSSTQTNNLTKKQKLSFLIRGIIRSPSQMVMKKLQITCDDDNTIPTPTSSCDVPGPVMYLYADESVPLYNFSDFNTRTYPEFVPTNSNPWQFISTPDVLVYNNNGSSSNVYYLIINNNIENPLYNYNITTPIGISVSGIIPSTYTLPDGFSGNVQIKFTQVLLKIYYSDNLVKTVSPTNLTTDYVMNLDISFNSPGSFSANRFIQNLHFNNIRLYTSPTYVYRFTLSVNITITPNNSGLVKYIALIANMSIPDSDTDKCTVLNPVASDVNVGSSISVV